MKSKHPDEVMEKFFLIWVSFFGPPSKILSDNGGEFKGKKWDSFCETFNVRHKPTAAESPFSNGICERHNALIGEMTEKVLEDVGCSFDIALMWAIYIHTKIYLDSLHTNLSWDEIQTSLVIQTTSYLH